MTDTDGPSGMDENAHGMPFGARWCPGGGADFRLWAPAARTVALLREGASDTGRPCTARRSEGGWWQVYLPDAVATTRYRWQIDGGQAVPDPACRRAPEGPHGWCLPTDPSGYHWRTTVWKGRPWQDLVFYELHVGTFTPEGTFASAQAQLPRLAALGFTAIELMPLSTFGGAWGWGYDGVLPFAPHPAYGSPDDLKRFIDAAHAVGLCVFLDVVYNHFGPDGNYLPLYAPQFFSPTHESPWGSAINFDQPDSAVVREFFAHNALYWIEEFRMDGLRLDAVHAIVDDGQPHVLEVLSRRVRELAQTQDREVHLVLENERNEPRWLQGTATAGRYDGQWNDDFHHALHVLLTGESHTYYERFSKAPMDILARVLTQGFAFPEGRPASGPQGAVPLPALLHFIGNHDQVGNRAFGERLSALASTEAVELALLLSLLTPATPMVFMGDEFGATTPFLYFANWEGELRDAVRAGRQREFSHAVPEGRLLPDPCDATTMEASRLDWVQAELPPGRQRSDLVREALDARRQWFSVRADLLATGQHIHERIGERGLRICWRYTDGSQCWLEANLGAEPIDSVPPGPEGSTLFQHGWTGGAEDPSAAWAPWSARWTCATALS